MDTPPANTKSISTKSASAKLSKIASVLRVTGWAGFWLQLGFAVVSGLMIMFAIGGQNFNRSIAPVQTIPGVGVGAVGQATTPGINIGIFWAACSILVLLFNGYIAFRQTRFAKQLQKSSEMNVHPKRAEVMKSLRLGVIVGLVGILLSILGGGATLGVLLSKSIAQPQGVAIYDPARIIRSLDIFVAMANMSGIAAHFAGTVAFLGLFNWLHHQ